MSNEAKADQNVVRALHPRVVFAFDFDETLAERTTDVLLQRLGVDPDDFDREHVQSRVDDGWETRLAEAHALVELSKTDHGPITEQTFADVATDLELYPGVEQLFDRLTDAVNETEPDIEVEFYLITAGFVEVPAATTIADRFTRIIGGHWAFDDDGAIMAPKDTVGHYAKVRHLQALAKGVDSVESDRSNDIHRYIPEDEWHVPYEQLIFVGDGDSDLPAFDFMEGNAGVAIAVHQSDDWESRSDMRDGRQVVTVAKSDFSEGSPLLTALIAAGQRAALWIKMRRTYDRTGASAST